MLSRRSIEPGIGTAAHMPGEESRENKGIDLGAGTKAQISRKDDKHVGINWGKGLVHSSCIPGFSELDSSEFNASTINTSIKIHFLVVRSYN